MPAADDTPMGVSIRALAEARAKCDHRRTSVALVYFSSAAGLVFATLVVFPFAILLIGCCRLLRVY